MKPHSLQVERRNPRIALVDLEKLSPGENISTPLKIDRLEDAKKEELCVSCKK